jgi:hypothetical protein
MSNAAQQSYAYLHIGGIAFEPDSFAKTFGWELGGVRVIHKRGPPSWKTEKRFVPRGEFPEDALLKLIKDLRPILDRITNHGGLDIGATIVGFREGDRAGPGLYLSTELVKALADLGASLDYDPY